MAVPVGINGFGRIGRIAFRAMAARPEEFEIVGINDLGDAEALALLLKYDSVQGRFPHDVTAEKETVDVDGDKKERNYLVVNGKRIRVTAERDPRNLPWSDLGADIVLESTGFFTSPAEGDKPGYDSHIAAGARKVVISAPSKGFAKMVVMGVNDGALTAKDTCVSNASCTTNCLAPMAKVLDEVFGLEKGLMTTVHAYTNDQNTADQIHSDPRRARAAAVNIIPTSTGAAKAVGKVLDDFDNKLTGIALRVPVPVGSVTDLVSVLSRDVTVDEVNAAMKSAADGTLKGIMEYVTDPIVSSDIVGNPHSSIFDSSWTQVIGGNLVKTLSWYDNEFGYSNRTADLIAKLASL